MAMVDVQGCDIQIRISQRNYCIPTLCIEVRILQYIILVWAYTVVRFAV